MVSGRTGGYSSEVNMGGKRVQLLVLLTFVVAVTNCADLKTTVSSTTASTTTSRSATNPASTTTSRNATNPASTTTSRNATNPASTTRIDLAISDNSTTLPPPDPFATEFIYAIRDPETGVACISVSMWISIKANYFTTSYHTKTAILKIPPTAEVRGTCRGVSPTMELIWAADPTLEGRLNRITLMIATGHPNYSLHVKAYELYIDGNNFPDAIQEGNRFKCVLLGFDESSASKNNGLYGCEPQITANTIYVDITISKYGIGLYIAGNSDSTRTEGNGVSGAAMTQWSGYLLLAAKILIFLKLGHQGI